MRITSELTDPTILAELGGRIARARLDRNLTQAQLAHEAGISTPTLKRLEAGQGSNLVSLLRAMRVLGLVGNVDGLVPEAGGPGPVELLRRQGHVRRRARPAPAPSDTPWAWGDEEGGAG